MNYESPINIIHEEMKTQFDNEVLKAVAKVGIDVNKDELIKALEYDRNQYQKGYEDAKEIYEKALDKACYELGVLDNNLFSDEQWKEWCMKNE